jgi:hypothetical protein
MSLQSEVDTYISRALDTAERTGASSDPIIRKPTKTLPGNGGKYGGSKKEASEVLTVTTHIAECLAEVSPGYIAAWNGRMRCTAGGDRPDQEHKAMVETAHQLHEAPSQRGAPALTMMDNIPRRMLPMDFQVTKEAAEFAIEAHIHHMCTVANLIKICCFEALAYDLVTNLGPERPTEWKAALINEAAGKQGAAPIQDVLGPVPGVDVMAKGPQGLLNAGDSFRADGGAAFLRS